MLKSVTDAELARVAGGIAWIPLIIAAAVLLYPSEAC
jgi:hypothetical protein